MIFFSAASAGRISIPVEEGNQHHKICVPYSTFKDDCNTCECDSTGTRKKCTERACPLDSDENPRLQRSIDDPELWVLVLHLPDQILNSLFFIIAIHSMLLFSFLANINYIGVKIFSRATCEPGSIYPTPNGKVCRCPLFRTIHNTTDCKYPIGHWKGPDID